MTTIPTTYDKSQDPNLATDWREKEAREAQHLATRYERAAVRYTNAAGVCSTRREAELLRSMARSARELAAMNRSLAALLGASVEVPA